MACDGVCDVCVQHQLSVDLHDIPAYITGTVAPSYSVEHQRALLLAWTQRFRVFVAGLGPPNQQQGAATAADPQQNIFTAGVCTRGVVFTAFGGVHVAWGGSTVVERQLLCETMRCS